MKNFNYKIKYLFILKTLSMSLLAICMGAIIFILDRLDVQKVNLNAVLIIIAVYVLPSFLLLIEYMLFSSNLSIQIIGKEITIVQNNLTTNYKYSDILSVTKFCSYPFSQNRTRCYLATDSFYFLKIKMNDSKEFVVTSLMTDMKYSQFNINNIEPRFIASISVS